MAVLFGVPIYRSMTRRLSASPRCWAASPPSRSPTSAASRSAAASWRARSGSPTSCSRRARASARCSAERMAEVGRRARKLGPDFHLVSISVDPERDTPERLAAYGARYGAQSARLVVPDRPGAGDRGHRRRRLQGRHGQGAAPRRRRRGRRRPSSRSSTARIWCWSTARCRFAATSRRRRRGSTSCMEAVGPGRERRLTRRGGGC